MNREIYKRVAPHLDRTKQDGGVTTDNMSDLFLLQRSNEQYKDYLKLSFCPELHGYKKDTRSNVDYITKGYSANSIQQELGPNLILNSEFIDSSNWTYSTGWSYDNVKKSAYLNNPTTTDLRQINNTIPIKLGAYYKIVFDYSVVSGAIDRLYINSIDSLFVGVNTSGKKTVIIQSTQPTSSLKLIIRAYGECYIDNVTVQEVLSNDLTQTSSANQPY